MMRTSSAEVLKGALAGLAGGLVASFAMDQFQVLWFKIADRGQAKKKKATGRDLPATEKAAVAVSEGVFGHKLTASERKWGGNAVHYAVGGLTGCVYGATTEISPSFATGLGLPYGTAVWAVIDEAAVPALGLSKPVTEYPLSTHAYALASHFVFGVTTELVRRGVRRVI